MALRISVVLATFNGERFISEQLQSIKNQRQLPDEVIVTDDGSSDETLAVVHRFAKAAPFAVRIFENQHCGWADNFMIGLSKAVGDVVCYCDQDDIWHPDKLLLQADAIQRDADVVLVTHAWRYLHGNRVGRVVHGPLGIDDKIECGDVERLPLGSNPGMTMMLRRRALPTLLKLWPAANQQKVQSLGSWIIPHDGFTLDVGIALGAITTLPDALVTYRKHDCNVFDAVTPRGLPLRAKRTQDALIFWQKMEMRYRERASIYRQIADKESEGAIGAALRYRATLYETLSEGYRRRVTVHSAGNFGTRAKAFRSLIKSGYQWAGRAGPSANLAALRDLVGLLSGR